MATDEVTPLPVDDLGATGADSAGTGAIFAASTSRTAPPPQGSAGARGEEESCVEDSGMVSPVVSGPTPVLATPCPQHYSSFEMESYDSIPVPHWVMEEEEQRERLEEVEREKTKGTRSRGTLVDEQVVWRKQDVMVKGHYKAWFPGFARKWIPLGKPQINLDLKSIASLVERSRPPRAYTRRDVGVRTSARVRQAVSGEDSNDGLGEWSESDDASNVDDGEVSAPNPPLDSTRQP